LADFLIFKGCLEHDAFTSAQIIEAAGDVYATSDGSAPNFRGSFGWSMKTKDGKKIAHNNGPVGGYRCSSYRAEAYGLLSLTLFIFHLHRYTKSTIQSNYKLFSDSLSAVTKVNEYRSYSKYYPSVTLSADWDVLQAVTRYCKEIDLLTLTHVKGHQDDEKDTSELSLEAQLNVEADELAGKIENINSSYACMITGTQVALQSKHGTITSKVARTIRRFASRRKVKVYMMEKYCWGRCYEYVDWECYGL